MEKADRQYFRRWKVRVPRAKLFIKVYSKGLSPPGAIFFLNPFVYCHFTPSQRREFQNKNLRVDLLQSTLILQRSLLEFPFPKFEFCSQSLSLPLLILGSESVGAGLGNHPTTTALDNLQVRRSRLIPSDQPP